MKTTGVIAALKRRARVPIFTIAATYAGFLLLGMAFVHAGNGFALRERDAIVNRAYARDPAAIAFKQNRRLRAAALDFTRNLFLGAIPNTVGGIAIVLPYPLAGYRGWVGGIVSVDRKRISRLSTVHGAIPYLGTLLLQLVPYSLAGGAGVYLGWAYLRRRQSTGPLIWGFPTQAVRDVLRIYTLIVPLFAIASLFEFFAA